MDGKVTNLKIDYNWLVPRPVGVVTVWLPDNMLNHDGPKMKVPVDKDLKGKLPSSHCEERIIQQNIGPAMVETENTPHVLTEATRKMKM